MTAITDPLVGVLPAATYSYMGVSRRVSMTYGNGVTQSFAGGTGLDRHGRVTDLHFTHPAITSPPEGTIHRYQYGYDAAGTP